MSSLSLFPSVSEFSARRGPPEFLCLAAELSRAYGYVTNSRVLRGPKRAMIGYRGLELESELEPGLGLKLEPRLGFKAGAGAGAR